MQGFEFNPLVPEHWQWFFLKNIKIADKKIDIIYDKTGSKYGKSGLQIFINDKLVLFSKTLQKNKRMFCKTTILTNLLRHSFIVEGLNLAILYCFFIFCLMELRALV